MPRARIGGWVPTVVCVAVALTGCVVDRSDDVAVDPCGVAAGLTEALVSTGGRPSAELVPFLDDLSSAPDGEPFQGPAQQVRERVDGVDLTERDGREAWQGALSALDGQVQAGCGFSMQAVVAGSVAGQGAAPGRAGADGLPTVGADAPAVSDALDEIAGLAWADAGYEVAVGTAPGTYVVVYGVESADAALVVCADVAAAFLRAPGDEADLRVEVQAVGGRLLAEWVGGVCS